MEQELKDVALKSNRAVVNLLGETLIEAEEDKQDIQVVLAVWQAKTMDVLVLQEGCIVSMSTPYPPASFRVRSGTVDIPQTTISYLCLHFKIC
ncbi:hypothetical protein ACQKKK_16260 [Peribacillus sp. NPDC006672]|uniref:hypothetical protein n=1 Tax=Peribacillus sp. NPDC006672 TaxID=3390606 RepID=UPI003CFED33E